MPRPIPTPFINVTLGLDEGPRGAAGAAGVTGPVGPVFAVPTGSGLVTAGTGSIDPKTSPISPSGVTKEILSKVDAKTISSITNWTNEGSGRVNINTFTTGRFANGPNDGIITVGPPGDTFNDGFGGWIQIGESVGDAQLITKFYSTFGFEKPILEVGEGFTLLGDYAVDMTVKCSFLVLSGDFNNGLYANGFNQIVLQASSSSGTFGPGGCLIPSNVALAGGVSNTDFKGGLGIICKGNMGNPPTQHPINYAVFEMVATGRTRQWFSDNSQFEVGGWDQVIGNEQFGGSYKTVNGASGTARMDFRSRGGYFDTRRFYAELRTNQTTSIVIQRYLMADETMVSFSYDVTMARRTNVTKAGRYQGKVQYRRTGGGAPTIVGAAVYQTDQETTAGDGAVFVVAGNEVQVVVTSSDADPRNWGCVLDVVEINAN